MYFLPLAVLYDKQHKICVELGLYVEDLNFEGNTDVNRRVALNAVLND